MLAWLLTIFLSYFIINLFGWVVHKFLHSKASKKWGLAHKFHHFQLYPAKDFFSDTYRDAGEHASPKFFILLALPILGGVVILWWIGILSLGMMIVSLLIMFSVGILDDLIHDAFHIRNSWLTRLPIIKHFFLRWRKLHYFHHQKTKTNFGIFNFWFDRLFGTFLNKNIEKIPGEENEKY